jgi:aminobenzoyl-glutamate utilization protein B
MEEEMGTKSLSRRKSISFIVFVLFTSAIFSDDVLNSIDHHKSKFENIALEVWEYAELGYQERQSSNMLAKSLQDEGFQVEKGVAGIPTAFIAEFNNGGPVIGILGEFDALPGLAQSKDPFKKNNKQFNRGWARMWPSSIWSCISMGSSCDKGVACSK